MILKGKVLNSSREERDMTGKDGTKRHAVIFHVLLCVDNGKEGGVEMCNLRSYDPEWTLPEVGKEWSSPRVRRYENYDGMIAEVTC